MNKRKIKLQAKYLFHKISPLSIINYNKYKNRAIKTFDYSNKQLTILSPNCIAGEIYNILNLKFLTPTINTSINRRDFLLLCENLEEYMNVDARFKRYRGENTPVISITPNELPEIEIAFPHDFGENDAVEKWNKRKTRIVKDNIYIICDDQNLLPKDIDRFKKLKYKNKILFTSNKNITDENIIYIGSRSLVERYQYKGIDGLYKFQHFFDFVTFLNNKKKINS